MRKVAVLGVGMTPFGKHLDKSLIDLMVEASIEALRDADALDTDFDAVYVGNMSSGELCGLENTATMLVDQLGLQPCAAERVENSPASGSSAIKNAYYAVALGVYDMVLVVGAEKMNHLPTADVTRVVAGMSHPLGEKIHGVTLPSLGALLARAYMERYGLTREEMALVAVKNHRNGARNPYAQIRKEIEIEDVLASRIIADPLRLYDCCPISDGAAALVLCPYEKASQFTDKPVLVKGIGHATDKYMFSERDDPLTLLAVKKAAEKALDAAGLTIGDVDVAELHDAFTILEIVESEDLGFFPKGEGGRAVAKGLTGIDGEIPINPSGGLKARGHPLGATGVAQAVEIVWQLRGEAGDRQVKGSEIGLTCNLSGFATNVIVTIYGRE